ncbi:MAG: hypothetical protein HQL58_05285 [Magnetococcales bacterium]|nr:hypothetical protein [Magnetococcales bacterium]
MLNTMMEIKVADALAIMESGPDDPEYQEAWNYLLHSRDPMVQQLLRQTLETVYGPMPRPTGYSTLGEPYWTVEVIASYLGVDNRDIRQFAEHIHDEWEDSPCVMDTSRLHTVH